jgi:hypothetical protein
VFEVTLLRGRERRKRRKRRKRKMFEPKLLFSRV